MTDSSKGQSPPFLVLGKILRPHGIRGELRVQVMTAYPERILKGAGVFVGRDPEKARSAKRYVVADVRKHQQYLILQFEGVSDRNTAEMFRDLLVLVRMEDAVPLEEGEFYLFQVIGLEVRTTDGEWLGTVKDVIQTGANDVYVVQGPLGEVLLPAIDECVHEVDIAGCTMTVTLLDGLLGE